MRFKIPLLIACIGLCSADTADLKIYTQDEGTELMRRGYDCAYLSATIRVSTNNIEIAIDSQDDQALSKGIVKLLNAADKFKLRSCRDVERRIGVPLTNIPESEDKQ